MTAMTQQPSARVMVIARRTVREGYARAWRERYGDRPMPVYKARGGA